ncbi:MAG TPA: M23 family metallopeptidase, partial [Armatimonadota bacterium]|nr:M23 family metallopeptidase [Armatimonadota bacterium]
MKTATCSVTTALFVLLAAWAACDGGSPTRDPERFSYDWRDLKFTCPLLYDASAGPVYGTNGRFRWAGNFVALQSLEDYRQGKSRDYMGNPGGHNGIDLGMHWGFHANDRAMVVAAAGGWLRVLRDGQNDHIGGTDLPEGFVHWLVHAKKEDGSDRDGSGNCVYLEHPNGFITQYAHLKNGVKGVLRGRKVGDWIPKGTLLGHVGSSGASSGPHLHFGVYSGAESVQKRPQVFHPTSRTDEGLTRFSRINSEHGVFVEPNMPDPVTGETMWETESDVLFYRDSGPYGLYDLAVSGEYIRAENPADDVTRVPIEAVVHLHAYVLGSQGETRVRI